MKRVISLSFVKTTSLYLTITLFITGWWWLAFKEKTPSNARSNALNHDSTQIIISQKKLKEKSVPLNPLQREQLQEALAGNTLLMGMLIREWDFDAELSAIEQRLTTKRLPRQTYIRSQLLAKELQASFSHHQPKLLPQTYVAASLLLALATPDQIVALPPGLRNQTELFPLTTTKQIPIDINRYHSEKIHLTHPDLAFVADYSDPAVTEALKNQGIQLYTIKSPDTLSDISQTAIEIGRKIDRPEAGELLAIFIEAAMLAIDNQLLLVYNPSLFDKKPRILYLNHYSQYSIPTEKTLTGQLLKRMGIDPFPHSNSSNPWMIPVDFERITSFNPDCLMISTKDPATLKMHIKKELAFKHLPAMSHHRIFFLDEEIQQSPSQYIVLAYYDIFKALAAAKFHE